MKQGTIAGFELSVQQRQLWLLHGDDRAYTAQCVAALGGPLDLEALRAALQNLVARHGILRTSFQRLPGMRVPVQVLAAHAAPALRSVDLRAEEPAGQSAAAERLLAEDAALPFDLGRAPLIRLTLLALSEREHQLLVTLPALCADPLTLTNIVGELGREYEAARGAGSLAAPAPQYVQFSEWQRKLLAAKDKQPAAPPDFIDGYQELPPVTLPYEAEPSSTPTFEPGEVSTELDGALVSRLAALAADASSTLPLCLLAAFHALLRRLQPAPLAPDSAVASTPAAGSFSSGGSAVAVAALFDGRRFAELGAACGPFARYLPTVSRYAPGLRFAELLAQLTADEARLRGWQEYFDAAATPSAVAGAGAAAAADGTAAASSSRLPSVGFDFLPAAVTSSRAGLLVEPRRLTWRGASFKLRLTCAAAAGGAVRASFEYDPRAFAAHDAAELAERYEALLRGAAAAGATAPVEQLPVVGPRERRRLLRQWSGADAVSAPVGVAPETVAADAPAPDAPAADVAAPDALAEQWGGARTVHEAFERRAALCPHAPALLADPEPLTFAHLNARANRLARLLRRRGVGPESVVGLLLGRGAEQVAALLAVWKAGGAYLPLDAEAPAARLGHMLAEAGARLVLTHTQVSEDVRRGVGGGAAVGRVEVLCLDDESARAEVSAQSDADLTGGPAAALPDSLAYVIYTSGSTGRPKGVMVTHGSVLNLARALRGSVYADVAEGEGLRVSLNAPLVFDASVKQLVQLLSGHTLVAVPEEVRRDAGALAGYVRGRRVEVLDCTPSQLRVLLDAGLLAGGEAGGEAGAASAESAGGEGEADGGGGEGARGSALRKVLVGGEAIDVRLWERLAGAGGAARAYNVYGPTECTVDATAREVSGGGEPRLGRALAGVELYVLDGRGELAPAGAVGELYVGGRGVGRGYVKDPVRTAERFVPHPYSGEAGARLYRTGDLGRWEREGELEFVGRADGQVKVRGYRVEVGEVEAALRGVEGVREAAVGAVSGGEGGDQRLVAYVVLDRKHSPDIDGRPRYRLPNGIAVVQQNRNETDYLYEEIFEKQSYLRHGVRLPEGATVFDVGANIGLFTLFVGQQCPDARVYAFEPLAPIFESLAINAELYVPNARLLQVGLADEERTDAFNFYPRYSMLSGLNAYADAADEMEVVKRFLSNEERRGLPGEHALVEQADELLRWRFEGETQQCRLKRLSDVMREEGVTRIDLLKIDVQKAELDVLAGIDAEDWPKIQQIVVEVHDKRGTESEGRVERVTELLERQGYAVVAEQDELLVGTDRYNLYAVRREFKQAAGDASRTRPAAPDHEFMLTTRELRERLKERLPAYMLPSVFVQLPALPLTPNGKLDRRALPAPEQQRADEAPGDAAAQTATEELVAGLFAEVLKVGRVGRAEDFFALGGHSLLATQVVARVRSVFGVEVGLRRLFEAPTVASFAAVLDEALRAEQGVIAPPLSRRAGARQAGAGEQFPLSFAQQRLWFLDQLEPGSSFYNMPAAVRLSGALNVAALERALDGVVARHEVLRTTFELRGQAPVQVVGPPAPLPLPLSDLAPLPAAERAAEVRRLGAAEARLPFDLARGPLARARLLRLGEDEHVLLLTLHHIISDGWSTGVLVREVAALYEAYAKGEESPLAELPVQYADYAEWQREWLQGEVLERQLAYWREQLAGAPALLELPTDFPRPPVQSFRGARLPFAVDPELAAALHEVARREGVTLFMLLLAGLQLALARSSGQPDVVVGTPVAGRTHRETEGLIGFFVNTLALRTRLGGGPTLGELLAGVREVCLGAYAHQDVPFEKLVEELQPERSMSHTPLFQVMLVLQNTPQETLRLPGLRLSTVEGDVEATQFDLVFSFAERGGGLRGQVQYNTALFAAETAGRLAGRVVEVLRALTGDLGRRVDEVSLMSAADSAAALASARGPEPDEHEGAEPCLVHEQFERQAALRPDAVAVVGEHEQLSYSQLNERANRLARFLRGRGVGAESVVGLLLGRTPDAVVAQAAVLKAGGAYLPLDAEAPAARLSHMLVEAGARFVLSHGEVKAEVRREVAARMRAESEGEPAAEVLCLDDESVRAEVSAQGGSNLSGEVAAAMPASLAYVIYTSGSTGLPKGVMVSHAALANLTRAQAARFGLRSEDRLLQFVSFTFDVAAADLWMAFSSGASLLLAADEARAGGLPLAAAIDRDRVTALQLPVAVARTLPHDAPLPTLRLLVVGGEQCDAELAARWAGGRRFFNAYGPTEATVCASAERCEAGEVRERGRVALGRALAGVELYVLDGRGELAPSGAVGELHVGGRGVGRGYVKDPVRTAERFVPHPFSGEAGARLYRTGDLGRRLADGRVEYVGRGDGQVKVRGYRVEVGEVEAALRGVEGVREAAVAAAEDGGGGRRLAAFVVAVEGQEVSAKTLREGLREQLPEYMVPSVFVSLTELPLTPSGKVDRARLPVPELRPELEPGYVAPRTPTEEALAQIWSNVLGVERVGIHDNFFELGGHSLLVTQVVSRIAGEFSVELSMQTFFQNAVVADLAVKITELQMAHRGSDDTDDTDELLRQIEHLSEAELRALLEERLT